MKKISIKREQSQAGLSFAEREKFRPQVKNKLLLLLVLLLTAATGAWAQTTINVTADDLGKAVCPDGSIYANVPAAQSAGKTAVAKIICLDTQNSKALALSLDNQAVPPATVNNATAQSRCEALNTTRAVTFGTWVLPSKAQWEAMIEAAGGYTALRDGFGIIFGGKQLEQTLYWSSTAGTTGHWRINFHDGGWSDNTFDSSARACLVINLPQTYSVTLNDGTENPTTWTASTDGTNFGALPIGGLKGDGSETVTLQYTGRLKVKGVTATSDAAPAEATYTLLSAATTEDVGKVVCAAGHLHDAKTAVPAGCTAVGILGKVTETGCGLILALKDATAQTWNTINGWTSVTSYAGATLKVLPDEAARGSLASYTKLGETAVSNWAVAQKSDYEAIFQNLGSTKYDENGYTYDGNVNDYITIGVGGTALSDDYWSATMINKYFDLPYYFGRGSWGSKGMSVSLRVRPVLGF